MFREMNMRILNLLAALSILSACVADQTSEDIASARAQWKVREPARYSYTFRTVCFCPPESVQVVRITFNSGYGFPEAVP